MDRQYTNNGFLDIKKQLMTLFMFKTTQSGDSSSSIWMMVYSFFMITVIEKLSIALPILMLFIQNYIRGKMKKAITENVQVSSSVKKMSSVTVNIHLSKLDALGSALLDLITNSKNTKSVFYNNNTFSLNDNEPVLLDEGYQIYSILITTAISTEISTDSSDLSTKQVVEIYSYNIKIDQLRKYLNEITRLYNIKIQNKLGDKIFFFNALPTPVFKNPDNTKDYSKCPPYFYFSMKQFQTNRKFINVVGDQSKVIKKRVKFFIENEKWYNEKGVPYTLGLLLSGCPGSGKTSTIKCIANETERHIINIHFTDDITISQMEHLFFNECIQVQNTLGKIEQFIIPLNKRIYVFEDVDCQNDIVMDRDLKHNDNMEDSIEPFSSSSLFNIQTQNKRPENMMTQPIGNSEKLTLSSLLNSLDGILETPGRIIIMTSNYPERLDKALVRPGRIDLICKFTKCTNKMICQFFENFYNIELTKEEKKQIDRVPSEIWSPAELTKILFENYENYKDALDYLVK